MSTESLNRLSDHFAEIVRNKILSKSSAELMAVKDRAEKFEGIKNVHRALVDTIEQDEIVDMDLFNYVEEDYKNALVFLAKDWDSELDHMKCIHIESSFYSKPSYWLLVYQISIGGVVLYFECEANKYKVFKHRLIARKGDIEDYWDYYFSHTGLSLV